jgi:phage replication initiation protein
MQKQVSLEINSQNDLVPPDGNTGAHHTGQRILIDWFAFTLPYNSDIFQVLGIPANDFVQIETKALGYSCMYLHGNIKVYTSEREDMGVHCELSGNACREYEFFFNNNWVDLIKRIKENRGHFSRIDLAIDDFDGIFTLDQIKQKVQNAEIVSYFKKGRILTEYNLTAKDNLGQTIYFGSPQSRIRIRMYNKAIEQILKEQSSKEADALKEESKQKVTAKQRRLNKQAREEYYRQQRLNNTQIWNRTEIQSRDERADKIAQYIMTGLELGPVLFGILKNYLNFVEPSAKDKNKSRWEISEFWQKFLGEVEKLQLTTEKIQRTIKRIKDWIIKQVAPSLALISMDKQMKMDLVEIAEIILFAKNRLKRRHYQILQAS